MFGFGGESSADGKQVGASSTSDGGDVAEQGTDSGGSGGAGSAAAHASSWVVKVFANIGASKKPPETPKLLTKSEIKTYLRTDTEAKKELLGDKDVSYSTFFTSDKFDVNALTAMALKHVEDHAAAKAGVSAGPSAAASAVPEEEDTGSGGTLALPRHEREKLEKAAKEKADAANAALALVDAANEFNDEMEEWGFGATPQPQQWLRAKSNVKLAEVAEIHPVVRSAKLEVSKAEHLAEERRVALSHVAAYGPRFFHRTLCSRMPSVSTPVALEISICLI
jgi:hypothetical protein